MEWDRFLKKYVWDDEKTPYLTAVDRLTRSQADHEIFVYCLFLGTLFGIVALASSTDAMPQGRSYPVAFYAFSVVCAAVVLGFWKSAVVSLYCAATPVAALAYFLAIGFHPDLGPLDHVAIFAVIALWLRYSVRIAAIGRAYDAMPERDSTPGEDGSGSGP